MPANMLTLVLAFYRAPLLFPEWRQGQSELPPDTDLVLRVAGGDRRAISAVGPPGASAEQLREAALFFVEQAFFAQRANHYRVLGLTPRASGGQIRENYRLLMRLFHPDRRETGDSWTDNYARRINQAYRVLHEPESRRLYDATLALPGTAASGQQSPCTGTAPAFGFWRPSTPRRRPAKRRISVHKRAGRTALPALGAALLAGLLTSGALLYYQHGFFARQPPAASAVPAPAAGQTISTDPNSSDWLNLRSSALATPVLEPVLSPPFRQQQHTPPGTREEPNNVEPPAPTPLMEGATRTGAPSAAADNIPLSPSQTPAAGAPTSPVNSKHIGVNNQNFSVPVPTAPALVDEASSAISASELSALVAAFKRTYDSGDLNTLMMLFGAHLPTSDKNYIAKMRTQYHLLFQRTTARNLIIAGLQWGRMGETASGQGQLFLAVRDRDRQWRHGYTGQISFAVVKDRGQLIIRQLNYVLAEPGSAPAAPAFHQ